MADNKGQAVSTIIRDDFFNDPFFKDWWADFDLPLRNIQFNRQISGMLNFGQAVVRKQIRDFNLMLRDIQWDNIFYLPKFELWSLFVLFLRSVGQMIL